VAGQPEGGARNAAKRAAGIVVLRRLPAGWQCLLLRAYRNWDFPKGLVEEGEMPLQAALREVREETGLAAMRFPWGSADLFSAAVRGRMPQRESRAEALVHGAQHGHVPCCSELKNSMEGIFRHFHAERIFARPGRMPAARWRATTPPWPTTAS
jgi:8-oxo-dGTP pyrophosphatase MutT (NUDIX family)